MRADGCAAVDPGYEARMPAKDAPVIDAIRRLSAQFPRLGYRRIHVYLEREGHTMGWDKAHRLWRRSGTDELLYESMPCRACRFHFPPFQGTTTSQPAWSCRIVRKAVAAGGRNRPVAGIQPRKTRPKPNARKEGAAAFGNLSQASSLSPHRQMTGNSRAPSSTERRLCRLHGMNT